MYRELFLASSASAGVTGLRPEERSEADDPSVAASSPAAPRRVFLTGGNQLRLTSVVAGTRLASTRLHLAHDRGAVIAGTSAGASALASHMMAFGQPGATPEAPAWCRLAAGLGARRGHRVDQHFEQRTRFGRLLRAVAQSPSLSGSGSTRTPARSCTRTARWR